ncbi:HNH endonuclease [Halovulum dunhuangense]|uniref:HNH endonuclease n=1 Tax=Halovulum dunhuangense TaxID=1505036 RepID=A0A849KPM3_9RHOB|nr:HNH endonuclease [Halovulum dunhuangense]NNU79003.1 HNH endonuclease [Halovulum dunhuangense]
MAKAVFIQNPHSIYKDAPGVHYHFPRRYLRMVQETVGDWVIFYEGRQGIPGYHSVQRVTKVVRDPEDAGHFYALLDRGSQWQFERPVGRADPRGIAWEKSLRGTDGRPTSGGANVSAVRRLSDAEFAAIVNEGLRPIEGAEAIPRLDALAEDAAHFDPAPLMEGRADILTSRKFRDASFQRMVKAAYGARCAISGLSLRNGGGRPEVQAAHIRPVKDGGPDIVANGIALSGTLHWMFDRGLISVAEDWRILVSHNKVPADTANRLFLPEQTLQLPANRRDWPHQDYLRWHREEVFGHA